MSYKENLLSIVIDSDPNLFNNVDKYTYNTKEIFEFIKCQIRDINTWCVIYPNFKVPLEFNSDVSVEVREVLTAKKDENSLLCTILGYENVIGDGSCPACSLSTNYLKFDSLVSARTVIKIDTRLFQALRKTFRVKEMISILVCKLNASKVMVGSANLQSKLNLEMQKNKMKLKGNGSLLWLKDKQLSFSDCSEYESEKTKNGQFISFSDDFFDQDDPLFFQKVYDFWMKFSR